MEQAYPLVFLCSDAAAAITGTIVLSDAGWLSSAITESFPNATFFAKVMLGRTVFTRLVRSLGMRLSGRAAAAAVRPGGFFQRRNP